MASYNYADIIGEAIESVINQTYTDWELIIVDDGSKDDSVEVIKKYLTDARIKLFVNEENLVIPHKYLHLRAFTLVPLLELIPNFEHPVLHKTITQLHNDLENPEMVYLYGTRVEI